MQERKKRMIDTVKGKTLMAFIAVCLFATFAITVAVPSRTAKAQFFCEWPLQAWVAVRVMRVSHRALIRASFMPSGSVPSLPALMRVVTVEAMQRVTGGEIIEPITLPGLDFINDIPGVGLVLRIVGGALNIPTPVNLFPDGETTYRFGGTDYMDQQMRGRLYQFWAYELRPAMQMMAAQLSASDINTTRMLASIHDMAGMSSSAAVQQAKELKAKKRYMPSDETCQFDTTATALAATRKVSRGITKAYTQQLNNVGNNSLGTIGATGAGSFYMARMQNYRESLCDPYANAGQTPCNAEGAQPSGGSMPSRTLFGRETIDLTDPDVRTAVEELTYNITGFTPPEPIPAVALSSTAGKEKRQSNREYLAQMDAITSLISGIVGERAPGAPAPDVAQMRIASGVNPGDVSPRPSEREIMQAISDQASNPATYVNLGDTPESVSQKEAYQKAYNLMLMYKMVEKQEKISTALAIETANMMKRR